MSKIPVFLGPCMLESLELCKVVADYLVKNFKDNDDIDLHFKGSFDKANRSSLETHRGPGLEEGLRILETIKKEFGLKTITDFHRVEQAEPVSEVADVLQVPAFLCRQTDVIMAGAKACKNKNRILKIKKGQFLAPQDTLNIVEKAASVLPKESILLTERGTSFGYQTLIVDMASFSVMKSFGVRTIHDATHCVQRPGGLGKSSGGKREFIVPLARAAMSAGADGLFMEVHPDPSKALSDAATQLPLNDAVKVVNELVRIKQFMEEL